MNCPKCNTENKDSAIFCKHCGSPLLKSRECPRCHSTNDPDALFCESCGSSLISSPASKENTNTRNQLKRIFSMILSITSIVFFVFAIGMSFADYIVETGALTSSDSSGIVSKSFGFSYFLIDLIKNYTKASGDTLAVQYSNIVLPFYYATFYIVIIGFICLVFVMGVLGIIKESKAIAKGDESNSDKFIIVTIAAAIAVYSLLCGAFGQLNLNDNGNSVEMYNSMGAGPLGIVIFGSILLGLKLAYRFVFTFKKGYWSCFASNITMTVATIIALVAISAIAKTYIGYGETNASYSTGFIGLYSVLNSTTTLLITNDLLNASQINAIISLQMISIILEFVTYAGIFIFSYLSIRKLFSQETGTSVIVYSSIAVLCSIILMVMFPIQQAIFKNIAGDYDTSSASYYIYLKYGIGIGSIVTVVLSIVFLGCSIAFYILRKKAKEKVYSL